MLLSLIAVILVMNIQMVYKRSEIAIPEYIFHSKLIPLSHFDCSKTFIRLRALYEYLSPFNTGRVINLKKARRSNGRSFVVWTGVVSPFSTIEAEMCKAWPNTASRSLWSTWKDYKA